jgi:hypothetical protein
MRNRWHCRLAVVLLVVLAAGSAQAATRTWTGTASGSWTNPLNWGGTVPVAGDDLVFPVGALNKASTNDFPAGTSFASIAIGDTGYALAGNAITLTGSSIGLALLYSVAGASSASIANALTLTGAAALVHTAPPATSQTLTLSGPITLGAGVFNLNLSGDQAQLVLSGAISASGPTATLNIAGGIVRLGASEVLPDFAAVNILAGTFDIGIHTETIRSLAGNPSATLLLGNPGRLVVRLSLFGDFRGTIAGDGTLVKDFPGLLMLSGNGPAFTGSVAIAMGTIVIAPGSSFPAATFTSFPGGSGGGLQGSGTVGRIVGGSGLPFIRPGQGSTGVLTTGEFWGNGSGLVFDLRGTTPGATHNQLVVNGPVTIGGELYVSFGYAPAAGEAYRIVDNTTTSPTLGTFSWTPLGALSQGAVFAVPTASGQVALRIDYSGGTGNDVVLTVVDANLPPLTIASGTLLPAATAGVPYATTITTTGGIAPLVWSVSIGQLPPGLVLNTATGAITGTPTAPAFSSFYISVTDGYGRSASSWFNLVVQAAPQGATEPIPLLGPWLLALLAAFVGLLGMRRLR